MAESRVVQAKLPCPACPSSDAYHIYDDGHGHCFSCGHHIKHATGDLVESTPKTKKSSELLTGGEPQAVRGITAETCAKWRYLVGTDQHGEKVHIANYCDDLGRPVAQKVRWRGKRFSVLGDAKAMRLYGQWLWRDGGKMVVVCEGEIDALTISQLQGNKWPVVSLPNGAQAARKSLAGQLEWLLKFDTVVLMFDGDAPGQKAVEECVDLFPPGRVKIARLPLKDANDMLRAGRGAEVIDAIWSAKVYRPDGIVTLADVREEALKAPETGLPWCFPTLTELTYGRRPGEVHCLGAGTSIGKTDFLTQQVEYDINVLGEKVGVIFLEQSPSETAKRLAGKHAGKQFHIPGAGWTQEELATALDEIEARGGLFMFNHWGSCDWETIKTRIRYLVHSEGCRVIYLDHLTALAAEAEDERRMLESLMAQAAGLAKELRIVLVMVSHLTTPEGRPHEEGGHVSIRHFKGSRAIGYWSHFMYGLERNTQDEDPEARQTTLVRVLKARPCGWNAGKVFRIKYDAATGRLTETTSPDFTDTTGGGPDF